jgi:ankyrin repeat protein
MDIMDIISAAETGNIELIKRFIKNGSDVNSKDNKGTTALMTASRNGHLDSVKILLQCKDIDVNAHNNWGSTALLCASVDNNIEIIKILVKNRADINEIFGNGSTLLIEVSRCGNHTELVELLIELGANIYARNRFGKTALWYATMNSRYENVKVIKEHMVKDIKFLWTLLSFDITRHIIYNYL